MENNRAIPANVKNLSDTPSPIRDFEAPQTPSFATPTIFTGRLRAPVPDAIAVTMTQPDANIFKNKQHFEILDGLRGIAALAVVVFHFMEWIYPDPGKNFIGHGFLAVDFFFCLSGFVISYAYDDRIGNMGVLEFFKSRLIRLHPLIVFGSAIGLLALLLDPFGAAPAAGMGELVLLFVCSVFLIPLPVMEERFFNLFSLNAPAWSLFWEYVANIFYAVILYRLGRRSLLLLILPAAIALCYVSHQSGNLMGGWGKDTFWHGFIRISYSFLAGMLIYRFNWIVKNRLGFASLAMLLAVAFLMPQLKWNWLAEAIVVLFYFPLLVSLGAGATLSPQLRGFCVFSGKISYPLYMTHYAAIWIFGNYFTSRNPGGTELTFIVAGGTLALIGLAYLTMVYYDTPIRKYLTRRRLKSQR